MVSSELVAEHIAWNRNIDHDGEEEVDGFVKKLAIHAGFEALAFAATPILGPIGHVAALGAAAYVSKKLDD